MIKQNIIMVCAGLSILSATTQAVIEPSRQTSPETELLLQELRTHRTNNDAQFDNIRQDITSLQNKVNPLSLKRIGKFAIVGLAGYGAYTLYQDYLQSSYKPQIDTKLKQAQALVNLIFPENSDKKTNDQ
jgi:hypothetical protein